MLTTVSLLAVILHILSITEPFSFPLLIIYIRKPFKR
jgi:hypothetical protein